MDKYLEKFPSTESLTGKRPAEESLWSKPKRPITKQKIATAGTPIVTSNQFGALRDDTDSVQTDDPGIAVFKQATRKRQTGQIPPILVELLGDWSHKSIKETIDKYEKGCHLQYRGRNKVKVQCYSAKGHQQVKEGLLKEKVIFHTFTRKDEKLPKAVIKGLPKFLQEALPAELASIGFPGVTITELKTLNRMECPPILAQLPSGSDMGKFKQIRYISNCVVSIQKYKPNNKIGTQCFRCQGFGHASKNCNRLARCVKCALDHATWECPKKNRDEPARCCNCNMAHPANYTQCAERIKYLERIQSKRETLRNTVAKRTEAAPSAVVNRNKATWAQVVGVKNRQSRLNDPYTQDTNTSSDLLQSHNHGVSASDEIQTERETPKPTFIPKIPTHDSVTAEMLDILNTIKTIKNEFTNCTTFMDKVILILTHLGHYV